jgi:hypothetical protein
MLDGGRPFNTLLEDTRPRSSAYHVGADTAHKWLYQWVLEVQSTPVTGERVLDGAWP